MGNLQILLYHMETRINQYLITLQILQLTKILIKILFQFQRKVIFCYILFHILLPLLYHEQTRQLPASRLISPRSVPRWPTRAAGPEWIFAESMFVHAMSVTSPPLKCYRGHCRKVAGLPDFHFAKVRGTRRERWKSRVGPRGKGQPGNFRRQRSRLFRALPRGNLLFLFYSVYVFSRLQRANNTRGLLTSQRQPLFHAL